MSDRRVSQSDELAVWRFKALNIVLAVLGAIAALALIGEWYTVIVTHDVGVWSATVNTLCGVMIFWAMLSRKMSIRMRGYIFLVASYVVTVVILFVAGLGGAGRSFAVALPVIVALIVGIKEGVILWVLYFVTMFVVGTLGKPWLAKTLIRIDSLDTGTWIIQTIYTLIPMASVFILSVLLHRQTLKMLAKLKASETDLQQRGEELESRVVERTEALTQAIAQKDATNEELRLAVAQADAANLAKSQFLANMSHELRTPLNGILGYAQILRRNGYMADEQAQQGLRVIQESGEHLLTLINDLLDLAKIESGRLELYLQPVELAGFLDGIAGVVNARARQKEVAFTFQRGTLPFCVEADEKRLRQVLINLLGNAVKFTKASGMVCFRVSLLSETQTHVLLRFEAEDTGIGITPEQMNRLFVPFEQLSDERQYRDSGTGLGLALSQQLVSKMGSQIQVESTAGQGSRFWFDVQMRLTSPQSLSDPIELVGYQGIQRKCLIIDSHQTNRRLLVELLHTLQFATCEAEDCTQAIAMIEQERPDLIFMDVVMRGASGCQAIQKIREAGYEIPIIAVSANVTIADIADCLETGANDFVPKPLKVKELIEVIGRNLSLNWVYRQGAASNPYPQKLATFSHITVPSQELEKITAALAVGDFQCIIETARQWIGAGDKDLSDLGRLLVNLAGNYDEAGIEKILEELTGEQNDPDRR